MAIWLQNKAKPHEKNSRHRQTHNRQHFCRICGKPVAYGAICQNCRQASKQTERTKDK